MGNHINVHCRLQLLHGDPLDCLRGIQHDSDQSSSASCRGIPCCCEHSRSACRPRTGGKRLDSERVKTGKLHFEDNRLPEPPIQLCPFCGGDLDRNGVCLNCGRSARDPYQLVQPPVGQVNQKQCPNCGAYLSRNQIYCPNCGKALRVPQTNTALLITSVVLLVCIGLPTALFGACVALLSANNLRPVISGLFLLFGIFGATLALFIYALRKR